MVLRKRMTFREPIQAKFREVPEVLVGVDDWDHSFTYFASTALPAARAAFKGRNLMSRTSTAPAFATKNGLPSFTPTVPYPPAVDKKPWKSPDMAGSQ